MVLSQVKLKYVGQTKFIEIFVQQFEVNNEEEQV